MSNNRTNERPEQKGHRLEQESSGGKENSHKGIAEKASDPLEEKSSSLHQGVTGDGVDSGYYPEKTLRKARQDLERILKDLTAELIRAKALRKQKVQGVNSSGAGLKAGEKRYHFFFHNDPNPLFVVDQDSGEILDVNTPAAETFQYETKALLEMSFWKLFDVDEAIRLWKEIHRFGEGEYVFIPKLWARKADRSNFFVHVHARPLRIQGQDGGDPRDVLLIRAVDITERLKDQAEVIQASKMATIGQVAMGIAHEINQPLNVMQVGADFLSKSIKRGETISEERLLKVSRNFSDQVERAVRIINHLREFGRKSDFELYPVNVNEPIRDVFTILGQQFAIRNIDVEFALDDNLSKILGDKNRLEQVFLNLVINARDAMEEKAEGIKKLTIATYREGGRVFVTVSDTGKGMPPQIQERIFAPFFTTKEVGKGTGLGLSICSELIKDFGGNITVESTMDVGTTFKIQFPSLERDTRHEPVH